MMMISAKKVTPSISAAEMIMAVWMLAAVSGWRAMLSTADLVRPPIPIAAPRITRPTPMARRSENGAAAAAVSVAVAGAWADAVPCASNIMPMARTADLTNFIEPWTPRWSHEGGTPRNEQSARRGSEGPPPPPSECNTNDRPGPPGRSPQRPAGLAPPRDLPVSADGPPTR